MLHLVGCLYYLYQWCMVKQISDNEIYLLIKHIKSVLWRAAKCLSHIEEVRCLKVNIHYFHLHFGKHECFMFGRLEALQWLNMTGSIYVLLSFKWIYCHHWHMAVRCYCLIVVHSKVWWTCVHTYVLVHMYVLTWTYTYVCMYICTYIQ